MENTDWVKFDPPKMICLSVLDDLKDDIRSQLSARFPSTANLHRFQMTSCYTRQTSNAGDVQFKFDVCSAFTYTS